MCVCVCVCVCIHLAARGRLARTSVRRPSRVWGESVHPPPYCTHEDRINRPAEGLGLYTILPSPYNVWCMAYKGGGGRWGGVYCAMVVQ